MSSRKLYQVLIYCIAAVWIGNGLFCKVLNLVPRHEEIVATILGEKHSRFLTISIGLMETAMALWILFRVKSRLNAVLQIVVVATMNTIEFVMVPGLLLWGKFNAFYAFLFILVVFFNEFYLKKKSAINI